MKTAFYDATGTVLLALVWLSVQLERHWRAALICAGIVLIKAVALGIYVLHRSPSPFLMEIP